MFRIIIFTILSTLLCSNVMATPLYDKEKNAVILSAAYIGEVSADGKITIYSEDNIEINLRRYDFDSKKIVVLCEDNPSLGFIFPIGTPMPKVTKVKRINNIIVNYVLKGEDALDLMDILYTQKTLNFLLTTKCPESEKLTSGDMMVTFDTNGLERVMKRLKK
jgi:hypothetical protein